MRTTRGRFPLQHLQAQHAGIKGDGLIHIAHTHASVEKLFDLHTGTYNRCRPADAKVGDSSMASVSSSVLWSFAVIFQLCRGSGNWAAAQSPGIPASGRTSARPC